MGQYLKINFEVFLYTLNNFQVVFRSFPQNCSIGQNSYDVPLRDSNVYNCLLSQNGFGLIKWITSYQMKWQFWQQNSAREVHVKEV